MVCLVPQRFLPVCPHLNVGPPHLPDATLPALVLQLPPLRVSSPPWLPISTPPAGPDECFFFISLVVGLPCSSIFCQFWLFCVFKLLLSFFCLCEEAQCVYLHLHLGQNPIVCSLDALNA